MVSMKEQVTSWKTLKRVICDYFRYSGSVGLLEQVIAFLRAVIFVLGLTVVQRFFDLLESDPVQKLSHEVIAWNFVGVISVYFVEILLDKVAHYLRSYVSYRNVGKYMETLQGKIAKIPAIHFEKKDFLDRLERAKNCVEYEQLGHFATMLTQLMSYYTFVFVLFCGYLYQLNALLPVMVLLSYVPMIAGQQMQMDLYTQLEEKNASLYRESRYLGQTMIGRAYVKETRMLGAFRQLMKLFQETNHHRFRRMWQVEKSAAIRMFVYQLLSMLGVLCAVGYLCYEVMQQHMTIGAFAVVFFAVFDFYDILEDMITTQWGQRKEVIGQIQNFYQLLDLPEREKEDGIDSITEGLKLNAVSFSYPDGTKVLENLSLEIKKGQTIALVGRNGSGKTTLGKLLLGIYQPSSGEILIDGKSQRTLQNKSAVFQHFQRYKLSLRENVTISQWQAEIEDERIRQLLKDVHFNGNTENLNLMLSPEFGGVDVSGGQWQRVAIARGLYRPHEFIVLDEPTASIDPMQESLLYQQFQQMIQGKTALLITHRLGAAKLADVIVVMEDHHIVEVGTHEALLAKNGLYAEMWSIQSGWYES